MKKYNYVDKTPKKKSAVALTFKIIATLLVVGAFTFCLVWTITNWDTVKNAVTNGTNIATEEDVNNAFKDGYNEGIKDKDNYTALVNDYKSKYEAEVKKNQDYAKLSNDFTLLQAQFEALTKNNNVKTDEVLQLKSQVEKLQTELDNRIIQDNEYDSTLANLNAEIASLKETIKNYEEYINNNQTQNNILVSYKIDDTIYHTEAVIEGSTPTAIENPTNTDHLIFNYWTLNGERVNPSEVTITDTTTFIANVTHKYAVRFYNGSTVVSAQIVVENQTPNEVSLEDEERKVFDGFSIDGQTVIDVYNTPITSHTDYYAVFTNKYLVTITDRSNTVYSELLLEGSTVPFNTITPIGKDHCIFAGFVEGENLVDTTTYTVSRDTEFVVAYKEAAYRLAETGTKSWEDSNDLQIACKFQANSTYTYNFNTINDYSTDNFISLRLYVKYETVYPSTTWDDITGKIEFTFDSAKTQTKQFTLQPNGNSKYETTITITATYNSVTNTVVFNFSTTEINHLSPVTTAFTISGTLHYYSNTDYSSQLTY